MRHEKLIRTNLETDTYTHFMKCSQRQLHRSQLAKSRWQKSIPITAPSLLLDRQNGSDLRKLPQFDALGREKPILCNRRAKVLSVAVHRISEVLDAVASNPQGTTASEVASQLKVGRQAIVRLLDSMVLEGIAKKDELTKRYRLSLKTYDWGTRAVAPYLPPFYLLSLIHI